MTDDDVYESVLAFLDQFIARGAAADVIDLRARLAANPEVRELLEAQLPTSDATEREAFDAMTAFFRGHVGARWPAFLRGGSGPSRADVVDVLGLGH